MSRFAVTTDALGAFNEAVEAMRAALAEEDAPEYAETDLPTTEPGDADMIQVTVPTDHRAVLDDLIARLDDMEFAGCDADARSLATALRRQYGLQPSRKAVAADVAANGLLGFYPHLVRAGTFKGVNLLAIAKRFWKLTAMHAEGPLPAIRWRPLSGGSYSGHAYENGARRRSVRSRVCVSLGAACTLDDAIEVLLHELVHASAPRGTHHGELFCRRLIGCAREAFGLTLDTAALLDLHRGVEKNRAYAIDRIIMAAMQAAGVGKRFRADPDLHVEPQPAETEFEIIARRAMAKADRAAAKAAQSEERARSMLAKWERKAKAAKRIEIKWRKKVLRYERQAAARGSKP